MPKNKKIRICFITPYSPKIVGGVGTFILEMCNYLETNGFEYCVIAPIVNIGLNTGKNLIELEIGKIRIISGFMYIIKTAINIIKIRRKIDIIHIQTPNYLNCSPLIVGKILGIPVITTFHGKFYRPSNPIRNFLFSIVEKILFDFSNEVTYVSADTKRYYNNYPGKIILNGINTRNFLKNNILRKQMRKALNLDDCYVILHLGRWVAHKGIYDLIDVFSDIRQKFSNARLILVGSGEKEKVLRKIKSLNLSEQVILFENVKNVHEYYCMSDLFILYTSQQEGLPIALLEAMACELPVIATNVSGIPEVIENNLNGFLIDEKDKISLIQKILWCIEHQEEIIFIGKNASRTIKEKFEIDRMAGEYTKIYSRLVQFVH